MSCVDKFSSGGHYGSGYVKRQLYRSIVISGSYKLIDYYLTFNPPSQFKDDMLSSFACDTVHRDITQLLVSKGAHITGYADLCIGAGIAADGIRSLSVYNYDFNWQDPQDGNTLLMKYALCPANGEEDDIIAMLQLLIELGARTDIRYKAGKQAKDIAVNPRVREFLKGI